MNVVDLDSLTKVTKTYSSGDTTVLYIGRECKSGMIVSCTDNHCSDAPIRRRAVWLLAWSVTDSCWFIWHVSSVSSIYSGKRLIDNILETGVL